MAGLTFFLRPEMQPFSLAMAFVAGLVLMEVIAVLLGGSLIGDGGDGPDIDGPDLDGPDLGGADLEGPDLDGLDLEGADAATGAAPDGASGLTAMLGWLGLGKTPFILWLAGVLTGFGVAGVMLQSIAEAIGGGLLPASLAALIALVPGLGFGARFARFLGRVAPQTETTAISRRSFGGRRGVIVQGRARRGHPAQARFKDGHGETHYLLIEPLDDDDEIKLGEDIAIIRTANGEFRAIRLDDEAATKPEAST